MAGRTHLFCLCSRLVSDDCRQVVFINLAIFNLSILLQNCEHKTCWSLYKNKKNKNTCASIRTYHMHPLSLVPNDPKRSQFNYQISYYAKDVMCHCSICIYTGWPVVVCALCNCNHQRTLLIVSAKLKNSTNPMFLVLLYRTYQ